MRGRGRKEEEEEGKGQRALLPGARRRRRRRRSEREGGREDARRRQVGVGLLGVDVRELAVEDKVAPERAERARDAASEERVGEDGAVLRAVGGCSWVSASLRATVCRSRARCARPRATKGARRERRTHPPAAVVEEPERVHAVRHGAPEDGHVVEHERRALGVARGELRRGRAGGGHRQWVRSRWEGGGEGREGPAHELEGDVEGDGAEAEGEQGGEALCCEHEQGHGGGDEGGREEGEATRSSSRLGAPPPLARRLVRRTTLRSSRSLASLPLSSLRCPTRATQDTDTHVLHSPPRVRGHLSAPRSPLARPLLSRALTPTSCPRP